jgi:hypothetical protein
LISKKIFSSETAWPNESKRPSGFREDFFKSANQKQELPMVAMFVNESELNEQSVSDWLISKKSSPLKPLCQMNRNLVGSILGRFSYKDCSISSDPLTNRGEDLKKSANQKQELPVVAMFVNGSGQNEHSL